MPSIKCCKVYTGTYPNCLIVQKDMRENGFETSITRGRLNVYFEDFVNQYELFSDICNKHDVFWEGKSSESNN